MPTIVCIVGASGSGKTTFIEALLPELKRRGHRVATMKHSHHRIDIDQPGKDSWRHRHAGADAVVLCGPDAVALIRNVGQPADPSQVMAWLGDDFDIVLAEGFTTSAYPKVRVGHNGKPEMDGSLVVAEVVGAAAEPGQLPRYAASDVGRVADVIESLLPSLQRYSN